MEAQQAMGVENEILNQISINVLHVNKYNNNWPRRTLLLHEEIMCYFLLIWTVWCLLILCVCMCVSHISQHQPKYKEPHILGNFRKIRTEFLTNIVRFNLFCCCGCCNESYPKEQQSNQWLICINDNRFASWHFQTVMISLKSDDCVKEQQMHWKYNHFMNCGHVSHSLNCNS